MSRKAENWDTSWQKRAADWLRDGTDALDRAMVSEMTEAPAVAPEDVPGAADVFEKKVQEDHEKEKAIYQTLHERTMTRGLHHARILYRVLSILVCVGIILSLLHAVMEMPVFGSPDSPVVNDVSRRYIEDGLKETGAVNIVAGMILDYRAFDTLGESTVLFIASCAVMILLRRDRNRSGELEKGSLPEDRDIIYEPHFDPILQKSAAFLTPVILLFGVYVVLNGHISPGGGFSGGAILGAALMLFRNAYGIKKTRRFFTSRTFTTVVFLALLFYAGAKSYVFYTGGNGLESGIPLGTPGAILSSGLILPLDVCVGAIVSCTMYTFFALFRRGEV